MLSGDGTAGELALVLTLYTGRKVTARNIGTWASRSARNGFPPPTGTRTGEVGRPGRTWDAAQVLAWFENYRPRGGAPLGNRNNRYCRRSAAPTGQEART